MLGRVKMVNVITKNMFKVDGETSSRIVKEVEGNSRWFSVPENIFLFPDLETWRNFRLNLKVSSCYGTRMCSESWIGSGNTEISWVQTTQRRSGDWRRHFHSRYFRKFEIKVEFYISPESQHQHVEMISRIRLNLIEFILMSLRKYYLRWAAIHILQTIFELNFSYFILYHISIGYFPIIKKRILLLSFWKIFQYPSSKQRLERVDMLAI